MTVEIEIVSKENREIKLLKKLAHKKYRQASGSFVIENAAIILDGLRDGYCFKALFTTKEYQEKHRDDYEFMRKHNKSGKLYLIDANLNKCFSSLDTPSGICAIFDVTYNQPADNSPFVYLNGINDPGNLGTIMRTMIAFGFHNLIVDETCADIYNAKTLSAAKDSIFKLSIQKDKGFGLLKNIQKKIPIYVSDVNDGKDLDNFRPAKQYCLVLGSESHGVCQEIINLANEKLNIKINNDIESLNVAIATSIFLYKFSR